MSNELFRLIRVQNRLSQRQLADITGLSKSLIAFIETGERPVSKKTAAKVMQALELTDEDLELYARFQSALAGGVNVE